MAMTVTLREITRETIREIEVRTDDPDARPIRDDVRVIDLARRLVGGAMRKGPRRVIETTSVPAIADGRSDR
jgi:hypothetical protein